MSGFVEWLESLNQRDSKARVVLRRSLAFEPGAYPAAFPYVEPFLAAEESQTRRTAYYLVAGLWAQHWRHGRGPTVSLGKAAANYFIASQSKSTETRFITLLDADEEQLPYRLRQMAALLKDQSIDFESVLKGLISWNNETKWVQIAWAKDFYKSSNDNTITNEEYPQ